MENLLQLLKFRQLLPRVYDGQRGSQLFFLQRLQQSVFIEPVNFAEQPFYPVAVGCFFKPFLADRKEHLGRYTGIRQFCEGNIDAQGIL